VAHFQALGTTVTDENLMREEIKRRLNSGNVCYHSVQNLLSFCLLSKIEKNWNIQNYRVFIVQAYRTSQYVVPRSGIFLGKWRSTFAGNSEGKTHVQSACALNFAYGSVWVRNLVSDIKGRT
jgi:hypothetical protein